MKTGHQEKRGIRTRNRIMNAILAFIEEHQYFPCYREIGEMTGIKSVSTVHCQVVKLIQEGRLETDTKPIQPRAIRVPGYQYVKTGSAATETKPRQ